MEFIACLTTHGAGARLPASTAKSPPAAGRTAGVGSGVTWKAVVGKTLAAGPTPRGAAASPPGGTPPGARVTPGRSVRPSRNRTPNSTRPCLAPQRSRSR